ncbi:MAG: tRNA (adenosine(37)-N6)-threonylcarbamoyltransferase complex transferase subunit TsaD [bacterium]
MKVLGIETSCDETAAAVLEGDTELLSNVVSSQQVHSPFGGVVPELASRAHIRLLLPVIEEALRRAGVALSGLDGVAVTCGPGLVGSLLVGICAAKAIASSLKIPFVGINHLEGHIFSNFLEHPELNPPAVCLIISGGHTELYYVRHRGRYDLLGRTRDDAAGEAFDKVAKMLGLGYPGGPLIDRLAEGGDPTFVRFPRPFLAQDSLDFSFSGLKTAVLIYVEALRESEKRRDVAHIAASFQAAVVDVLVEKSLRAARQTGTRRILLAGGVAGNKALRKQFKERTAQEGMELFSPSPILCTDNAAMIAAAGSFRLKRGERSPLDITGAPGLRLEMQPLR